jgi:hypothetical protein
MKMHSYNEWSIGVELDVDEHGRPRAIASVFEPGKDPHTTTGLPVGGIHSGSSAEEAEEKAVAAAKEWIDRQLPRKKQ